MSWWQLLGALAVLFLLCKGLKRPVLARKTREPGRNEPVSPDFAVSDSVASRPADDQTIPFVAAAVLLAGDSDTQAGK